MGDYDRSARLRVHCNAAYRAVTNVRFCRLRVVGLAPMFIQRGRVRLGVARLGFGVSRWCGRSLIGGVSCGEVGEDQRRPDRGTRTGVGVAHHGRTCVARRI